MSVTGQRYGQPRDKLSYSYAVLASDICLPMHYMGQDGCTECEDDDSYVLVVAVVVPVVIVLAMVAVCLAPQIKLPDNMQRSLSNSPIAKRAKAVKTSTRSGCKKCMSDKRRDSMTVKARIILSLIQVTASTRPPLVFTDLATASTIMRSCPSQVISVTGVVFDIPCVPPSRDPEPSIVAFA